MAQAADIVTAIQNVLTRPIRPKSPPSTCAATVAHGEYIATVAASPPYTIHGDADSIDIKDVADELAGEFAAFAVYLTARIDALAHITGRDVWSVDCKRFEALYREAAEELLGGLAKTAEAQGAYETWRAE